MTTLNQMVDEVLRKLASYGLNQDRFEVLLDDMTSGGSTFFLETPITDVSPGPVQIDSELIWVRTIDIPSGSAEGIRGFRSTATTHTAGALVYLNPLWPRVNVEAAINDAIIGSYPALFAVATETFTASAVQNTYTLNSLTENVLEVRATDPVPTGEWRVIDRYRVDTSLNLLTINDGMTPGEEFKVIAKRRPTALASGASDITTSGLSESAKIYVVAKACADLVANMDSSRLPVASAQADDMEANRPVGSGTRIAQFLLAIADRELESERRRLQEKYPPTINMSRGRY